MKEKENVQAESKIKANQPVDLISNYPPYIEWHIGFAKVPFQLSTEQQLGLRNLFSVSTA